jgi:hypothetical protein
VLSTTWKSTDGTVSQWKYWTVLLCISMCIALEHPILNSSIEEQRAGGGIAGEVDGENYVNTENNREHWC